ncbi:flavin reductase-like protein [Escherichia coli]|uniref:Flavin reductase-like protein n=1 Tax=Escherichia coli TaxID=562 RepID=A0A377K6Z0_ECOLX|nr:flavin reductase-like protein [Escherichia coli]
MSQFIPVELHHASRLLNHGPTVMITSFDEQSQRRNIMAAAWSMPVEFEPPRVAIVVDKSTWTRELIERNGKFGIVIPGVAATNWTWAVGSVSGREEDKFNCYGIPVVRGPVLGLPLVEEKCLAWMECRLLPATSAQENTIRYLAKWYQQRQTHGYLSKAAGSLMMISSIRCII